MNHNLVSQKALRLMVHPAALAGLTMVLLNDAWLKPFHPSWLTGKLSDLGVLLFAPFVVALVASFALPLKLPQRVRWVGCLSFGLTLTAFLLLKLSPLTNAWFLTLPRAIGLPLRSVADPSDLLMLPGLALSAWLWLKTPLPSVIPDGGTPHKKVRPLAQSVLLVAVSLVLLGDAAAPDFGISCLEQVNGAIHSQAGYGTLYTSSDGGLTWSSQPFQGGEQCKAKNLDFTLTLDGSRGIQYRVTGQKTIERSTGGLAWQVLYRSVPLTQAQSTYLDKVRTANVYFRQGPLDAMVDPASGNLVAAMGVEGVLVTRPGAQPAWAPVSGYTHIDLRQEGTSGMFTLLSFEFWLAVCAGLLWLFTVTLRWRMAIWHAVLIGLGWLLFAVTLLALYPGIANASEIGAFSDVALLACLAWTLVLGVISLVRQWKPGILTFLLTGLLFPVVALIFFLPYLAWGLSWLGEYWTAAGLAAVLLAILTGLGLRLAPRT